MALIVKKFGGSSVANLQCIKNVAEKIHAAQLAGDQVVVVVSAMQGETDKLLAMAHQLSALPNEREVDLLLATGEQVTIALLTIALTELGCKARSYTGAQVKITTDHTHSKARILDVERDKIYADVEAGVIVVVAGFQGVDHLGNITTLGRGGSDTTAVALAAALGADECQIYTDVDGVYTADPRLVSTAQRMDYITFPEMLELASLGAKVLQLRSVELAGRYNVPVRVLSTFTAGHGTLISDEVENMELHEVTAIAHSVNEAHILLRGVVDAPQAISNIIGQLAGANIEIDMLAQSVAVAGLTDFSFTVQRSDLNKALNILNPLVPTLNIHEILVNAKVGKLSVVGLGMRSHAGITSRLLQALYENNVHIQQISISEIKVSVILDETYIETGVRVLHQAFDLEKGQKQQTCQKKAALLEEKL